MRARLALSLLAFAALFIACETGAGADAATKPEPNPYQPAERSTEGKLPTGWLEFEDGTKITIELAANTEDIRLGLSYRESLCETCGLYFVFPGEDYRDFWMRQMHFPIDIIWINRGKVVGVVHDAPPQPGATESELQVWTSPEPVRNVLEVPAGFARAHGIGAGTGIKVWMNQ